MLFFFFHDTPPPPRREDSCDIARWHSPCTLREMVSERLFLWGAMYLAQKYSCVVIQAMEGSSHLQSDGSTFI